MLDPRVKARLNAIDRHVGTLDVNLGLQLGILVEEGYREITARLREAGFGPDSNEAGKLSSTSSSTTKEDSRRSRSRFGGSAANRP